MVAQNPPTQNQPQPTAPPAQPPAPTQQFIQNPQAQNPTPAPVQPAQTTPQTTPAQAPTPVQTPNPNQPQPSSQPPQNPSSAQATLLFSEIRDNLVIMKDGSFRAVVACQSINFDLMSTREQESVEYSYQNFLNSLEFTVQILVRSQRVDISPYIDKLAKIRRETDNMLLGVLMDDYVNFISILAEEANIMDKSFFVAIPYYPSSDVEKTLQETKNFFKIFNNSPPPVTTITREVYENALNEIENRVSSVIAGLASIGIYGVRLNSRQLAALYYNFNNPDTAIREPLIDFNLLAKTYVRKGQNG